MTVSALLTKEKSGAMYRVIDASRNGYMTSPYILVEADKNVVFDSYRDAELVGFSAAGKNKINLYVLAE